MLTIDDCIGLSGLTQDEVDAIAAHEHLPEIVAAELGCYLLHREGGEDLIFRMIADDVRKSRDAGDIKRAAHLKLVLQHFLGLYPRSLGGARNAADRFPKLESCIAEQNGSDDGERSVNKLGADFV